MKRRAYKRLSFSLLLFMILFFAACFSHVKLSRQNMAFIYSEGEFYIKPQCLLYHISADSSVLHYNINTDDLLYIKDIINNKFFASFTIKYELFDSYEAKTVIDSLSIYISDTINQFKADFIKDSLTINIPSGKNYILKINTIDNNRNTSYYDLITVKKTHHKGCQNFYLTGTDGNLIYEPYFNKSDTVIIHNSDINLTQLYVKYYPNRFQIATPPFNISIQKPTNIFPDTVFSIQIEDGISEPFQLKREGVYRILVDSAGNEGLTIFRFHEDYPNITEAEQMIYSARYLTTRQEFDNMIIQADKKHAIELFWLEIAGNKERARQLIKNYYGRVRLANKFFTSYHEGWKTDRGMVFIIYGTPSYVYKTDTSENWIYGEPSNLRSINFMFYKVDNPLVENDYMLSKSEMFRDNWYFAISNWRR
ncbi:MAG: GWxTD domain-containing protein [Bacteroidales bacterium]|nr:GWxTD domain-containing protein [Bacteroidales bacterium]